GDTDPPAVFFGDAFGHGQAQAGAGALGGVVGVEDFGELVGGDAGAGVDHVDDGFAVVAGGGEDQLAVAVGFGHRLDGVEHEVENRLLHELGVDVGDHGLGGGFPASLHFVELGLGREEVD